MIRVRKGIEGYEFSAEDVGKLLVTTDNKNGVVYVRYYRISKFIGRKVKKGDYITEEEMKKVINSSRSEQKADVTKYLFDNGYIKETFVHSQTRFEISFMRGLEKVLNEMGVTIEFQKRVLNYRLDAYLPQYNLAIEYDEAQHNFSIDEDQKREEEIKEVLGCKFIRLDYQKDDFINIGKVIKAIIK